MNHFTNALKNARRPVGEPRPPAEIVYEIACTYGDLSPEIISWDGERSASDIRAARRILKARLKKLIAELGRPLGEMDAYNIAANPDRAAELLRDF